MNVKLLVIIWPGGYIITNDVTFTHMGNALVFYFEGWSNFLIFKKESAGHAFLVGFREK